MKKFITLSLIIFPLVVGAHSGFGMNFSDIQDGVGMMRYLEDRSLGGELHEQMEGLMNKMIAGTLTEAEADQLVGLMNQYPGPSGIMMNRLGGFGGWGMMSWGGSYRAGWSGFWFWLMALGGLIWLGAGALLLVWLWKQINKK